MSPSSKGSKKPTVTLSKVPSVRELCESLGFQHASLKDTNEFMDVSHTWRKSYKTGSGTSGTELLRWNELAVQLDLTAMAESFLQDNGNANRFWAASRNWHHDSDIQYPEDRARIIELLKQLFWKQNRYAANNSAYAHKGVDGRDQSRDKTTPIHQTSPQANGRAGSATVSATLLTTHPKVQHQASGQGAAPEEPALFTNPTTQGSVTINSHVTNSQDDDPRPSVEKDIYEVPNDDHTAAVQLPKPTTPSSKHARTERPAGSQDLPPRKKKKLREGEEKSPRRTVRRGVPRTRPGIVPYVSDELYEEIMKTPPTEDSPPGSEIIGSRPAGTQDDSFEPSAAPIPNMSSFHSTSEKRCAAPTAPMVAANEADGSINEVDDLIWPKPQVKSPSQKNRQYRTARLKAQGIQTSRPEKSILPPILAGSTPQIDQDAATETSNDLHETTNPDTGSSAKPHASRTASESTPDGILAGYGQSAEAPQPSKEVEEASCSAPDTPTQPSSDQRVVRTSTAEIRSDGQPQDHPQSSKTQQGGKSSSVESKSSNSRTKTQVPLWIITREPRYTEERWDDGKFQGTPLSDFLEGISQVTQRGSIEKVKLTLRTPTFDTKITVFKDAEDSWISAKGKFVEKLKKAKAEANAKGSKEPASYEILVEPFYEQNVEASSKVDEDDEEFEF